MTMKPSQQNIDTLFEDFVQELPDDYQSMAYDFKAFARARKIKTAFQLLQIVMLYCGLDFSLRTCAGKISHIQGYISDEAVKKDLRLVFPGSRLCCQRFLG